MKYITLNKCHCSLKNFSISLDDEDGNGVRITPIDKCCGRFSVVQKWNFDINLLKNTIIVFENAVEELDLT